MEDVRYEQFMKEYYGKREKCPYCDNTIHEHGFKETIVAYLYDPSKEEEYKDLNKSTCMKCFNTTTIHDRVLI